MHPISFATNIQEPSELDTEIDELSSISLGKDGDDHPIVIPLENIAKVAVKKK